ncbi:hypothetical protein C2845_PM08G13010 [Panicum miliaceum]|uniref:Uncharacterized protein n=1 Tax=Panicum miliaceum TaxID=4540 RepID=A0A3L6R282_PANMI|nr:hypothetical protein C2845_PM08G13010 [Panicum miliaceum]
MASDAPAPTSPSAAVSLEYLEADLKDTNKKWAEEWFVVVNLAPGFLFRTGFPPVPNATWEVKPSNEEMAQLTQPIQERVHQGYEYSGRDDPTRVMNRKVPRTEAASRVAFIISGEVRDKGCPKAYFLNRPTTKERVVEFWYPAPLPEGQHGKAVDPPAGLPQPAALALDYSSDSSIGSELGDVVEVTGPATGASSVLRRWRAVRKVALSQVQKGAAHPQGGVASALNAVVEEEAHEGAASGGHADLVTSKLERWPAALVQSLPTAVPLKTSFSVHRSEK